MISSSRSESARALTVPINAAAHGSERITLEAPVGRIKGWSDGPLLRATGIPYARAARFERPEPVLSVEGGEYSATRWAPASPQIEEPGFDQVFGPQRRPLGMSEDSMHLSVTAPRDIEPGEVLPVMVWVHGGSYVSGCGDSSITDPAPLVLEHRVVAVSVTYRLGVLGFLGSAHGPANLGLMDIREAFRWVRRNIAAFGGDPGNVTAFGESAGADSLAHLLAAMGADVLENEVAEILFDRAILTSPPLGIRRGRSKMTRLMGTLFDASFEGAEALEAEPQELLEIQAKIIEATKKFGLPGMMPFGVEYGEEPMPAEDRIEEAWRAIAPHVPVMIGTVGTETSLFAFWMEGVQKLRATPGVGEPAYWKAIHALSRRTFTRPANEFAELWASSGGSAQRFTVPFSVPGNPHGSPHGIDVMLLFAREDTYRRVLPFEGATWEEIDRAGRAMRRYFTDFARGTAHPHTTEPRAIRGYPAGA